MSVGIVVLGQEVIGTVIMVFVWCVILVSTDNVLLCITPIFLTSVFLTKCYNSFDTFIVYWWLAFPLVISLAIHLLRFRKRIKLGLSFYGLCGVSLALLLGGLGYLPIEKYFRPMTLYYTLGLSVGMLLVYVLFQPYIHYNSKKLFSALYLMGALAMVCVAKFYVEGLSTVLETGRILFFQSSNNLSTILMITMPIPLYFAEKNRLHLISFTMMYFCIVLADSRGGIVFGTIEFIVCLIFFMITAKKLRLPLAVITVGFVTVVCIAFSLFSQQTITFFNIRTAVDDESLWDRIIGVFINKDEARAKMLLGLWNDFADNPLFGRGLGCDANTDIYNPIKGALYWYHMWFPQVVGSMGILGVITYFSNLYIRIKLVFKRRTTFSYVAGMSYFGLFLMSQVNPGEFCPIPYAMIAVLLFIAIEDYGENDSSLSFC